MKIIIHYKANNLVKVKSYPEEDFTIKSSDLSSVVWELAERFPEEIIGWCEKDLESFLTIDKWYKVFHHDLIMASYPVQTTYIPHSIGYIDQSPFINVNREVLYGTWLMSSDVGGIKGEVLLKFAFLFRGIKNFGFLLNSIGKIGQENGLFCYSAPNLIRQKNKKVRAQASTSELFLFVFQHYKSVWTSILFWCYISYERNFPIVPYLMAQKKKKFFKKSVDLAGINIKSKKEEDTKRSIDVIIPTIGRPAHLLQVMEDLKNQILLPQKVIVVEQDPVPGSVSQLSALTSNDWPFKVIHHFIHRTGACNARNLALKEVTSDWVFFCDDDNRFDNEVLMKTLKEISKYGCEMINTAYRQPGETIEFQNVKQWGTFGAGNSIVKGDYLRDDLFSSVFEHGYGEDKDVGRKLRNMGCDIIYHPGIEILHLKAPIGGFRQKIPLAWDNENPLPKPSPTLMVLAMKYFTPQQIKGYKISLSLKFYKMQSIKNPIAYIRFINRSWKKSEVWANKLLESENSTQFLEK